MIQIKKTILTLVALLAVTTGAWAESKPIGLNVEYAVCDVITSTTDVYVYYGEHPTNHKQMAVKITSTQPLTISMIDAHGFGFNGNDAVYYLPVGDATGGSAGVIPCVGESTGDATVVHVASGTGTLTDPYVFGSGPFGTPVPLTRGTGEKINEWTLTNGMPAGNVTVSVEYFPQAALTAAPTAINDVPATTDGAIVKAGTVANIGSTETAQGTVMYYVSPTALDDAALLALAADQWTADVPTAEKLAKGEAYVYYYVRGNDSDTDEENFSDGDILAANALTVTIAAEPTKVTMAVNDKTMGTAEVCGQSKVEWTADTWKGWTADTKVYTVDDITMTSSQSGHIREYISEDKYNNSLFFFVRKMVNDATVTFSTTGDPFSRIEFTMIGDYSQYNPDIIPNDNWTFEGKSAVWEGEATKSLTLQSCSTNVSKITFFKGAIPDGVTINTDGTFTVAKTATVTLKATPAEGYKFLYWEDDQTNTNPVREVTIESGMADMTYKAVFAEITYNVTFAEGTDPNEWSASPDAEVKKGQTVTVTYTGTKKVIGVKAEKKAKAPALKTLANATAEDLGKIAGADGNIYDTKAAAEAAGTTAVAMIAYVGSDTGNDTYTHGMALALSDEGEMNWSNAKSTCEGKSAVSGAAWLLPSRNQWKAMFKANGGNEGSYTGLNTALATAGGDSSKLQKNERYWSSSEQGSNFAWVLVLGEDSAGWDGAPEDLGHHVRACLAF